MFIDTRLNSVVRVLHTMYQSFLESAMKVYRYLRSSASLMTIDDALLISKLRSIFSFGKQSTGRRSLKRETDAKQGRSLTS